MRKTVNKSKLNTIEVLISRASIYSYISEYCFKKYDGIEEATKILKISRVHQSFYPTYKTMLSLCLNFRKRNR